MVTGRWSFVPVGLRLNVELLKVIQIAERRLRVIVVKKIVSKVCLCLGGIKFHLHVVVEDVVHVLEVAVPVDKLFMVAG